MLSNAKIMAVIPVTDLNRAREFYEEVVGLGVSDEDMQRGSVRYQSAGTHLLIYQRATASSGEHTIASFHVGDGLDEAVDRLMQNGVTFDTFQIPGVEMNWDDRGLLHDGGYTIGWFKDPDGNILAISDQG